MKLGGVSENLRLKPNFPPLNNDYFAAGVILVATFLLFWLSPVHQVTDSNYSMLLSQSLLEHRSFTFDGYAIPHNPPLAQDYALKNGEIYQLEWVGDHLYYFFPPGSSVLSVPFVAIMNAAGISAANADGTYNLQGEIKLESLLAALLMAFSAAVFYFTARLVLPAPVSVVVALGGALGTQVWSTASRAMWSDTWGILLLAVVVYLLLAAEVKKRAVNPVLLATLLAWAYFVRPTANLPILGITIYIAIRQRQKLFLYLFTGAVWLAAFVAYSWHHFAKLMPNYYLARRLSFNIFFTALAGHLVSPSRGLLIYVPIVIFIAWLLIRYRQWIAEKPLLWLALFVLVAHMVIISGFDHWWGGFCYGSRLTTSLVPFLLLLAVLGLEARLRFRQGTKPKRGWSLELLSGGLLLLISIFINGRGALARETWKWNVYPENVDIQPSRLWSWRDPQMLAGIIRPPQPREIPLLTGRLELSSPDSAKYLWYGWSGPERELRWTDGNEATLVFSVTAKTEKTLHVKLVPYLVAGKLTQQRLTVSLNGNTIQTLVLDKKEPAVYSFALPANLLQNQNVLTFHLPDAVAPTSVESSYDLRPLGIAIWWLELQDH